MFFLFLSQCLQNLLYLFLYFENSSFPKPLTAKEEAEAFEQFFAGNLAQRDRIISHNLRLVAHIAKKYYLTTQDKEDFISIGTIGLIKAVNTFNLDKGRFSTYAARCIENEILMTLRTMKKNQNVVFLSDVLESDKDGNNLTREDLVADSTEIGEIVEHTEEVETLYAAISKQLDNREAQIIRLRYGLGQTKPMSQQKVCEILGISRSYVSRIEKKALEKLKSSLNR